MTLNFHSLGGLDLVALVVWIALVVDCVYGLVATIKNRQETKGSTLLYDKTSTLNAMRFTAVSFPCAFLLFRITLDGGRTDDFGGIAIIMEGIWLLYLLWTRSAPDRIYCASDGLLVTRRNMKETIPYANIDCAELVKARYHHLITLHFLQPGKFGNAIRFPANHDGDALLEKLANRMRQADGQTLKVRPHDYGRVSMKNVFIGVLVALLLCGVVLLIAMHDG
jgi:hypothetical protein